MSAIVRQLASIALPTIPISVGRRETPACARQQQTTGQHARSTYDRRESHWACSICSTDSIAFVPASNMPRHILRGLRNRLDTCDSPQFADSVLIVAMPFCFQVACRFRVIYSCQLLPSGRLSPALITLRFVLISDLAGNPPFSSA